MTETAPQTQDNQTEQLSRFRAALDKRDLRALRHLLNEGITSLPPDLGGEALLAAVRGSDRATAVPLLRCGADPNYSDGVGETPVYAAVEADHPDLLRDVLAAGGNPDGAPVPGAAPILCAVERGHLAMLEILIDAGAATNVTYPDLGYALLHKAVHRGYRDITAHLVKTGMSIQVLDDWGDSPLHTAVRHSTSMIPQLLQLGADVNARSGNGSTPLIAAAFQGDVQAFELLVSAGADPLTRENHGHSTFDTALTGRRPVMAAWILERYPSLAPSGEDLDKSFVRAVRGGATPVVKQLAALGADLGQKPDGRTLLQIAPPKALELKRLLRSLKTGASLESAMSSVGDDGAPAPNNTFPAL